MLDERLDLLDEEFEGRLHFRCVGPLSPFSFATVEVQIPAFEDVDKARRHLELGETTTASEIKRAYRRMAGQYHPDHNPDDPEAEARMTEITKAYQLLTAYAENVQRGRGGEGEHPGTSAPQHPCSFSQEAVEQMLLITVRRQEIVA
ncbi:MAG: J domain-containing protein [Chloroflexi bacterium]|nr:J domain-containing protein [Chloroflexota bacterium]